MFMSTKFSNLYITKYESITQQKIIISWLTQTSEIIKDLNDRIDRFIQNPLPPAEKKIEIEYFLVRVKVGN